MRITNAEGLPQIVVDALKYDTYKVAGSISCTTLIDAVQIRQLKKKHYHEITTDASEMLFALLGTAVHNVLERAHISDHRKKAFVTVIETLKSESKRFNEEAQEKLKEMCDKLFKMMEFLFPEIAGRYLWELSFQYEYKGMVLYGTFDVYDKIDKILYDYKMCSVWSYAYPESRRKWNAQTNIYAFLLRENGFAVDKIFIVAIFRDWSSAKVEFSKLDYPKTQLMTIPIPVQDQEKVRTYIHAKMDMHIAGDNGDIRPCDGNDKWQTTDEYAVLSKGLKRAIRKFLTEDMANAFIRENSHKHKQPLYIQIRPGDRKRCQSYCPVSEFCPQKKREDTLEEEKISQ